MTTSAISLPFYEQVLDFLAGSPSPQEIINFHPSVEAQSRFLELLEINRQQQLPLVEREELDHYIWIDQMFSLLKTKVCSRLDAPVTTQANSP